MLAVGAFFSALLFAGAAGLVQDTYNKNVFASFEAGVWSAQAAFFDSGYVYGPEYQCRLKSADAVLTLRRPKESDSLEARWSFLDDVANRMSDFELRWIKINGKRFEVTELPWRLADLSDEGVVTSHERSLLAIRRDASEPWLPFTYLGLEMLKGSGFELGYSYEDPNNKWGDGRTRISLDGFREATKWCGQQLLRDRQDETRVRRLIR